MEEPRSSAGRPWLALPGWHGALLTLCIALLYLGSAKVPLATGLAFQAYLFWPAAAVAYTAYFVWGRVAFLGLALGGLVLNLSSWLPWPSALAMWALQCLGPWLAWRLLLHLGTAQPDLGRTRDLLRWLGISTVTCALFSSCLGSIVVGLALPGRTFTHGLATAFSWFLGDLTALLCLGPACLSFLPRKTSLVHTGGGAGARSWLMVSASCLALLSVGRIHPQLSGDLRLALQFALVLPVLWMALRFGPRGTSAGLALLSLGFLIQLRALGPGLPDEVFRFTQCQLLVLGIAALITAATAEETRRARTALQAREQQALRMEAVGTLAGGLVHEFNNQLTVMLGNLDRLREQPPTPLNPASTALQRIEEAALSMGHTVQQLKALSHQAPLWAHHQPLSQSLSGFVRAAQRLPERIAFELVQEGDPLVGVDPDLLSQALQHLLANSRDAIPDHGRITLRAREQEGWAHLSLEDTGVGMSTDTLHRACDPFFTTKPMGTGRGLGLSLAFSLIKQMGGRLTLSSEPGRGTTADILLPLGGATHASPAISPRLPLTQTVLLADDEAGIRELTREFLESEGFSVVEAADGSAALEAFESDPQAWDLVILDLVMPRLGGTEVLARIAAARPDLPALLISGYSSEFRPGLLASPHRAFLAKPFRLQELREAMARLGQTNPTGHHAG